MIQVPRVAILLALLLTLCGYHPTPAAGASAVDEPYLLLSSEAVVAPDGREIGKEVLCACYSAADRITVLRVAGDEPISPALDRDTDFDGVLWLIDVGDRGAPQVVIRFHRLDGVLTADLYDDQDGDGRVALALDGRETVVTESDFWTVRVAALDGYWHRDGRLAPNFDLTVDDRMYATFGGRLFIDAMRNDGHPDVEIRVRGPLEDDPRSYDWRNVYTPFPASSGIYRTTLMVREEGVEPSFTPLFPWYLLGATDGPTTDDTAPLANALHTSFDDGIVKYPGRSHPPIQVDWAIGTTVYIGEFVASRGSDHNWFTYSIKRVEPGALTNPNFESPFAFYDLAEDDDYYPELAVRVGRFGDGEPASEGPPNGSQGAQVIRYTWDQANDKNWSYKLGLLGRQTVDGRVTFADFELQTIPYADVPTWVIGNSWDIATFVAAERPVYTSEGIYDWDFQRDTSDFYGGTGSAPADLVGAFSRLGGGLRGDYSMAFGQAPRLTFNPIDRELHLERAEAGIWNLMDGRQVRFLNLANGRVFDGWQLWDHGRLVSQLYRVPGGLLYSDQKQTLYLLTEIPDELFSTLPPATHADWVALGEALAAHAGSLSPEDPGNLFEMFEQFDGAPIRIATGPIADFRPADSGVRFVVDVVDDPTRDVLAALTGTRPRDGVQVVSLIGDMWALEEGGFASPALSVDADGIRVLRESRMRVTVRNEGSMPIDNADIDVVAVAEDGREFSLRVGEPVAVEGHGRQDIEIDWSPRTAGNWTLEVRLYRSGGNQWSGNPVLLAEATQPFEVAAVPQITVDSALNLGWPGVTWERLMILLALVNVAGVIAHAGLRRRERLR